MYRPLSSYDARLAVEEDLVRQLVEAVDVDAVIDRMELHTNPHVSPIVRSLSVLDFSAPLTSLDERPSIVSPAPTDGPRVMRRQSLPPPPLRNDSETFDVSPRDGAHTERLRNRAREEAFTRARRVMVPLRSPEGEQQRRRPPQSRRRGDGEWLRPLPHSPRYLRNALGDMEDAHTATTEEAQTPHNEEAEFDLFNVDEDEEEGTHTGAAVLYGVAPPRIIEREQHRRPPMMSSSSKGASVAQEKMQAQGPSSTFAYAAGSVEARPVRLDVASPSSHLMSPAFSPPRSASPSPKVQAVTNEKESGSAKASAKNGLEMTGETTAPLNPMNNRTESGDSTVAPSQKETIKSESQPARKDKGGDKLEEQGNMSDADMSISAVVSRKVKQSSQAIRGRRAGSTSSYSYSSSYSPYSSDHSVGTPHPRSPGQHTSLRASAKAMVYPPMQSASLQPSHPLALRRHAPKDPPPPPHPANGPAVASGASLLSLTSARQSRRLQQTATRRNMATVRGGYGCDAEDTQGSVLGLTGGKWRRGLNAPTVVSQLNRSVNDKRNFSRTATHSMVPYMSFLPKSKLSMGGAPAHANPPVAYRSQLQTSPPRSHQQVYQANHYPVKRHVSQSNGPVVFNRSSLPVSASLLLESNVPADAKRGASTTASLARVGHRGELQELVWQSSGSGVVAGHGSRGPSVNSTQSHSRCTSVEQRKVLNPPAPPKVLSQRARSASNSRTSGTGQTIDAPPRRFAR